MSTFIYTDIEASDRSRAVKQKDESEAAGPSRIIKRKDRPAPLDQEKIHLQHDAFDSSQRSADRPSPRAPEIVDLAAPTSWTRRTLTRVPSRDLAPSPGAQSKHSFGRQSEMSFGILDYYTGDASPCCSPTIPATSSTTADSASRTFEPQRTDPAIERFDFGLKPSTPTQPRHHDALPQRQRAKTLATESDTQAGAERAETSTGASAPTSADRCVRPTLHKKTYSLFPSPNVSANRVPQIPSTPKATAQPPPTTLTQPVSTPPHQQPNPAFRPRKESLPRSMRSRKDSMISHRSSDRQIPLRILSSSTTASASSTTTTTPRTDYYAPSTALSASSPPDRSRWSDETIASPTATTVRDGGPRTSFGSLLGAVGRAGGSDNSDQYPACFFEDDDEEGVPLRRKLAWKKWSTGSSSSTTQGGGGGGRHTARREKGQGRRSDRGDPRGWRKVTRVLLCGGCGAGGRERGV
ncbi:hypothetical protein KC360_g8607 [Hortaea werneckii]|nr:hypothetical protein KC325_g5068 [Hortaea werneckii]KAI6994965.1 hypothetical protein KC359_g4367 [Hortaea werneckii]KAI7140543.1 hypothetical protein KC344_g8650 [Hortaea werneckii]KAI7167509.1 hypothetical protein KC360_g8607 [Hortaea werneckii]